MSTPLVRDLSARDVRQHVRGDGLRVRTGPFVYTLKARVPEVEDGLALLYAHHPLAGDDAFVDFEITIERVWRPRGGWQVRFESEGERPFALMPQAHAYPLVEWAMNWCIATHVRHMLVLHAAVLERDGRALVLPAPPGSGKSTLCAGLMLRGWRLLSDEMALVPTEGPVRLLPLGRAVSLKNQSIDLIRAWDPRATFNQVTRDTVKGSVAHLQPLPEHVARLDEPARPGWVVFPRFSAGAATECVTLPRPGAFMDLMAQSFNYQQLGAAGFRAMSGLLGQSRCHYLQFGSLADGVAGIEALAD